MSEKRAVEVWIQGRPYRLRVEGDEAPVREAASLVEETIEALRSRGGSVDSLELAVLASLNLARRLVAERTRGVAAIPSVDAERIRALVSLVESAGTAPV
jgi:cell division protein ZapA (FtsZ GTPase activity inhibitor)